MPILLWILGPPGSGKSSFYETVIQPLNLFTKIDSNEIYANLLKANNIKYDLPDKIFNKELSETDLIVADAIKYIFDSNLESQLPKSLISDEIQRLPIKEEIKTFINERLDAYHSFSFSKEVLLLLLDAISIDEFPNPLDYIKYKGPSLENFRKISIKLASDLLLDAKNSNQNICILDNGTSPRLIFDTQIEFSRKRQYQSFVVFIRIDNVQLCNIRLHKKYYNKVNEIKVNMEYYGSLNGMSYLRDFIPKSNIYEFNNSNNMISTKSVDIKSWLKIS